MPHLVCAVQSRNDSFGLDVHISTTCSHSEAETSPLEESHPQPSHEKSSCAQTALSCVIATHDQDDVFKRTSSHGTESRPPDQQRRAIDVTSNRAPPIDLIAEIPEMNPFTDGTAAQTNL